MPPAPPPGSFADKHVEETDTEQQGGPSLGRAMDWPWPLACKVRSGALGGRLRTPPCIRRQNSCKHYALVSQSNWWACSS
jgi:hypothetical protein